MEEPKDKSSCFSVSGIEEAGAELSDTQSIPFLLAWPLLGSSMSGLFGIRFMKETEDCVSVVTCELTDLFWFCDSVTGLFFFFFFLIMSGWENFEDEEINAESVLDVCEVAVALDLWRALGLWRALSLIFLVLLDVFSVEICLLFFFIFLKSTEELDLFVRLESLLSAWLKSDWSSSWSELCSEWSVNSTSP